MKEWRARFGRLRIQRMHRWSPEESDLFWLVGKAHPRRGTLELKRPPSLLHHQHDTDDLTNVLFVEK